MFLVTLRDACNLDLGLYSSLKGGDVKNYNSRSGGGRVHAYNVSVNSKARFSSCIWNNNKSFFF
jgi:hypothetical protein